MSVSISSVALEGVFVRLEPLAHTHASDLYSLGNEPLVWDYLPRRRLTTPDAAVAYIDEALRGLANGTELPFAVIERASGQTAGTTRYLDLRRENRSLEIGATWYGVSFQRTAVNTETKFLLLEYAFEKLDMVRVEFKTDARNVRSQKAIERLGAVREGLLRKQWIIPKDGFIRDTILYSIIDEEWPEVKSRLRARLAR